MVVAKPDADAPGFVGDTTPRKVSLPAAPRPLPVVQADIGTASGRALLASGFGPDEMIDKRSAATTATARAMLAFQLYPDPAGIIFSLLARTASGVAPHSVTLVVNGEEARPVLIAAEWSLLRLKLPESTLASGRNQIEIVSDIPTGGVALDLLRAEPVSARLSLDVGAPATRHVMTKGWGSDETIGGRSAARLRPPNGELTVRMRPVAMDYVLGVVAMSETVDKSVRLPVEVNAAKPGLLAPVAEYGPSFVRVPRSALQVGENTIKLSVAPNAHFAIDFLTLRPIESGFFIDIGSPEARQNLATGFSADEVFGLGTSAWSDASMSRVVAWMKPLPTPYNLSVRASAFEAVAPLVVEVSLNGKSLGVFNASSKLDTYDLAVPGDAVRDGQNVLEFKYAATRQPSKSTSGSRDTRQLALRYDWLELSPKL